MTFVVLVGPPGAGKGTQARLLEQRLGLRHIATGDLFRQHLNDNTKLGQLAKGYMNRGDLVPDSVTTEMVYERLSLPDCASGALLDGYPRTLTQAQSLDSLLAKVSGVLRTVLYLHVDRDLLIARLSGRWVCRSCGSVYHAEFRPTRLAGVCDACGGHLVQLPYDTADVQQRRINVYYERTEPLLEYYRTRELLAEIDGQQSIERVTRNLLQAIANAETDAGASE